MHITVVCAPTPQHIVEVVCELPAGACVADALQHCTGLAAFAGLDVAAYAVGVWGRVVPQTQLLQAQDRVELYRPLTVDPKVARRERFAQQGASRAGLFAKKRPGAKAGY